MKEGKKVAGRLAQKDGVGALGPGQGWTAARKRQAWHRRRQGLDLEEGWAWIFVALNPETSRAWAGSPVRRRLPPWLFALANSGVYFVFLSTGKNEAGQVLILVKLGRNWRVKITSSHYGKILPGERY